eukprot:IDg10854t1
MSRFFRGAEDSDSSSDSSSSSSDDEPTRTTVQGVGRSRFLQSDSEDEDVKRVIRSAATRRSRALIDISNNIKNHINVGDWSKVQEDFDALNEGLKKIMKTDMVTGRAPQVPDVYIRSIITVEDYVKKTLKEKPRLSKTKQTSLNKMKLRVPKNNKQYKTRIDELRASGKPTLYDFEYNNNSDEEDSDDSDSSDSDSDSSSSSSSDDNAAPRGSRWMLKKTKDIGAASKKTRKERKPLTAKEAEDAAPAPDPEDNMGFVTVAHSKSAAIRQGFDPDQMTEELVDTKMLEILQGRGRKGTNRQEQILLIESLASCAKTPKQEIEIMLHLVASQFDAIPAAKLYMPAPLWRSALENAIKVV